MVYDTTLYIYICMFKIVLLLLVICGKKANVIEKCDEKKI